MTLGLLVVAVAGAVYLAIAAVRLLQFAMRPIELARDFLPTISVLKPVAGIEPNLYRNLASFCEQDYDARYEVIFCLASANDPALPTVQRVVADFAWCPAAIALGRAPGMLNPKIANVAKAGVEPQGEIVVIADSDIRVDRKYLRALAAGFASERVGAITCLYSGEPNDGIVSRLGALQIQDQFAPSVLVALALGALRFCLGATMAVRRRVLDDIGGLAALGDHLADDHKLGELVAQRGYEVELCRYPVRTDVNEITLAALWSHELRWARTHRALAPAGYAFSFLTFALPLALLYLIFGGNRAAAIPLLASVLALRVAVHYVARYAFGAARDDVALIVPRDLLSLAVWAASLFGRTVRWRGRIYRTGS
ncbi:MAG: bacteriohopanetetrol glucosamine biosynthesis glycosyltransferase HpnI [Candidatus Eremiobacteraeota bacterium]|nr:bacteriohopanetetrol glucosamine biosynthesis glycosyltransferase HpnI [Candidatus Eremiobacteraeota bacterium]